MDMLSHNEEETHQFSTLLNDTNSVEDGQQSQEMSSQLALLQLPSSKAWNDNRMEFGQDQIEATTAPTTNAPTKSSLPPSVNLES